MTRMTKTEAAAIIAREVVQALIRQHANGQKRLDGKLTALELLSEYGNGHNGAYLQEAATTANLRTVLIHAKRQMADYIQGQRDLATARRLGVEV